MYCIWGLGGQEYLLILLAITAVTLPIVAVLIVVIRAFRYWGRKTPKTDQ